MTFDSLPLKTVISDKAPEEDLFVSQCTFPEEDLKDCIICIGSTGSGKSSTITKCTGQDVPSSSGQHSVTSRSAIYEVDSEFPYANFKNNNKPVWVDTVGWDDEYLKDENTFKEILQFIGDNKLFQVKAIVWTVLANVRKDALLTKQAQLINKFKKKEIWNNVVIIVKQSSNPQKDAQGALACAEYYNRSCTIPTLGYTYLEEVNLNKKLKDKFKDKAIRDDFLIKTDQEVATQVWASLATLGNPVQVVFQNQHCLDCGQTGDARLMDTFCHMEKISVHSCDTSQFHPGKIERFHSETFTNEHMRGLYRPWYSCQMFCCKSGGERHICCESLSGQPGCSKIRTCCKKPADAKDEDKGGCMERFSCCKVNVAVMKPGCDYKYLCCDKNVKSKGCVEKCKKCNGEWGKKPIIECYEKEHNIVVMQNL